MILFPVSDMQCQIVTPATVVLIANRMMQANPKDGALAELNAAYMTLKKMPQDSINNALKHV